VEALELLRLLLYVLFFAFLNVKMGDPSFLSMSFFFGPVFASSNDCLLLIFFFLFLFHLDESVTDKNIIHTSLKNPFKELFCLSRLSPRCNHYLRLRMLNDN